MTLRAQPATPDSRDEECFYAFGSVSTLGDPFSVSAVDKCLFECVPEEPYPIYRHGNGPYPELRVSKNVYNLTPINSYEATFVVDSTVRDILSAHSTAEFQDTIIARAFWFPFTPAQNFSFETGIASELGMEDLFKYLLNKYPCEPPNDRLYCVIPPVVNFIKSKYSDIVDMDVGYDAPPSTGVRTRNVQVSRQIIVSQGLVFDRAFMCRADLFAKLNPYLHRPWFWAQKYLFPQ